MNPTPFTRAQVGFIVGCDPLGELLSTVFATWLVAKMGMTQSAVVGMLVNGVSSVVFGAIPLLTHDVVVLNLVFVSMRIMNGIATNITYVSMFTLLCCLQPDKIGQVTGRTAVLSTIGLILGPPFGGLLDHLGASLVASYGLPTDVQFLTPFVGCSIVLVAPSVLLWSARRVVDLAVAASEEEEEEEPSFTEELRRMKSVFNTTMLAGITVVVSAQMMCNALYTILSPHLGPRCDAAAPLAAEHFPFAYSSNQISLVFASGSIAFLPISVIIGNLCDEKDRDFPWMRRTMAYGLLMNVVSYGLMGPVRIFGQGPQRAMESDCAMVLSQMLLGIANALTLIAAFPFFEGVCAVKSTSSLSTQQRIAIAGVWYNASYSIGCTIGPLLSGVLATTYTFDQTLLLLLVFNGLALLVLMAEGMWGSGPTAGFWPLAFGASTTPLQPRGTSSSSSQEGTMLEELSAGPVAATPAAATPAAESRSVAQLQELLAFYRVHDPAKTEAEVEAIMDRRRGSRSAITMHGWAALSDALHSKYGQRLPASRFSLGEEELEEELEGVEDGADSLALRVVWRLVLLGMAALAVGCAWQGKHRQAKCGAFYDSTSCSDEVTVAQVAGEQVCTYPGAAESGLRQVAPRRSMAGDGYVCTIKAARLQDLGNCSQDWLSAAASVCLC